jgi:hypothetical protein
MPVLYHVRLLASNSLPSLTIAHNCACQTPDTTPRLTAGKLYRREMHAAADYPQPTIAADVAENKQLCATRPAGKCCRLEADAERVALAERYRG